MFIKSAGRKLECERKTFSNAAKLSIEVYFYTIFYFSKFRSMGL